MSGRAARRGRRRRWPRRNARRNAFAFRQRAGHLEGGLVGDGDDLVDERGVEHGRNEAGADALDLVRAAQAAGQDRARRRFHGDDLEIGAARFQNPPAARQACRRCRRR